MANRQGARFKQIVWSYLHKMQGSFLLAVLCMLGFTLTELLQPWPVKLIFDHILLDKALTSPLPFLATLLHSGKVYALVVLSLSLICLALLKGLFSYSQLYITSRLGSQMVYALRRELFGHLQRLSLAYHNRTRSGELLTKITSDTNTLKDVFTESVLTCTAHSLTLLGILVIMLTLNWTLSLLVFATFPILFYALSQRYRQMKDSAQRQRKTEGQIVARLSESLTVASLIQVFGRERYEEERFEAENAQTLQESIRTVRLEAATTRTVEIINAIGTWAVIFFGSLQVLKGQMTPGVVLVFVSYLSNMYKPLRNLAKFSSKFSRAMASAERIAELLDLEPDIQDAPDAIEASRLRGEIVFQQVSFAYEHVNRVLRQVSFTIAPGQRVALIGTSGAGKSTVVSLLLRLYDPQEGAILIDGVNIKDYRRESLRREIGVVLQDAMLFGTTIQENIAYGKPDATMEEIVAAATAANAHDFILALPHGYNTIIGESGVTLSGGQRQRIAIARAIIRDTSILILDEPMTGLDVESEAKVQEALERLMVGKTCLLITHNLWTAATADLVLALENGRVVRYGAQRDLTAGSQQHYQLYERTSDRQTVQLPVGLS